MKIVSERDSPESSTSSVATEPQLPPPQPEPARPPAAPSGDDLDSDDDNASVKERTRSFTEQLEKVEPVRLFWNLWYLHIDDLVQDCSISIANTLEILQSCTKPLIASNVKLFI